MRTREFLIIFLVAECCSGEELRRTAQVRKQSLAVDGLGSVALSGSPDTHAEGKGDETKLEPGHEAKPEPGHEEADSHHEHETGTASSKSTSFLMLFGCLSVAMICLYATGASSPEVSKASWTMISDNLAIVMALLLKNCLSSFVSLIFPTAYSESLVMPAGSHESFLQSAGIDVAFFVSGHAEPAMEDVWMAFVLGTCFFVIIEVILLKVRQHKRALMIFGIVGGHMSSFLASDSFAVGQEVDPWKKSVGLSIVWVLIGLASTSFFVAAAESVRHRVVLRDGEIDQHDEAWLDQCTEFEDEIIAFTVGLQVTQVIRFALLGEIVSYHGLQQHKDDAHVWRDICTLLACAWVFCGLCFLLSVAKAKMAFTGWKKRAVGMVTRMCSMTSAWSFLFWGKWFFWKVRGTHQVSDPVVPLFTMAYIFMLLGLIFTLVLDKISRSMELGSLLGGLLEINTFTIGLAWESVFSICTEEWAQAQASTAEDILGYQVLSGAMTCLVVLPAWAMYILPNTQSEGKEKEKETKKKKKKEKKKEKEKEKKSQGLLSTNEEETQ